MDAVLIEIDSENVAAAQRAAARAGLTQLEAVEADASTSDVYAPYVPGDIVLACGVFGNISDGDLEETIRHLSMLCGEGAAVIWTRHWKEPVLIARIQQWFAESGFGNLSYDALENAKKTGVGVALLKQPPLRFQPGYRFFTFLR